MTTQAVLSFDPSVERWLPIAGYVGLYEVSDHGRVRSLDRHVTDGRSGGGYSVKFWRGRIIKPRILSTGYLSLSLAKDGKASSATVHTLVARAFLPADPPRTDVNHIDSNRANNVLSNLEWCTPKENMIHSAKALRMQNVLVPDQVRAIRAALAKGAQCVALAAEFGVSNSTIHYIKHGKGWVHVS